MDAYITLFPVIAFIAAIIIGRTATVILEKQDQTAA